LTKNQYHSLDAESRKGEWPRTGSEANQEVEKAQTIRKSMSVDQQRPGEETTGGKKDQLSRGTREGGHNTPEL